MLKCDRKNSVKNPGINLSLTLDRNMKKWSIKNKDP